MSILKEEKTESKGLLETGRETGTRSCSGNDEMTIAKMIALVNERFPSIVKTSQLEWGTAIFRAPL